MSENISAQTTPTFKKSFFGDYFRYKLRTQRGYIILFAILNFISTAGFAAAVYFIAKFGFLPGIKDPRMYSTLGASMMLQFSIWLMAITVILEVVMLCILPAVSFKFFNKRSHMDTLGALPLTTSERFFGDMLSGAAVFGISFVPEAVIAVIIAAVTEAGPVREINELTDHYPYFPWKNESVLKLFAVIMITELLCYAAAYAISCFVASCCGKTGSSILFSLVMNIAPVLIIFPTAASISENAVGYDVMYLGMTAFPAIAPVGTLIQTYAKLNSEPGSYAVLTPLVLVILLTIALFTFGAYIAAMKRKTERIDREFVFDAGYYIVPIIVTLAAGMIGVKARIVAFNESSFTISTTLIALASSVILSVIVIRYFKKKGKNYAIIGVLPTLFTALISSMTVKIIDISLFAVLVPFALIALATCLVLAYLREHSFKNIWKGAAVFVSVISACFLIGVFIQCTNGFGISHYLPSAREIDSVDISGGMITDKIRPADGSRTLTVKTKNGIETIISEHQKLIDDLGNYESGSRGVNTDEVICLTYHYKNGMTSFRAYCYDNYNIAPSDRSDYKFVDAISKIPELYDMTAFGILGNPDMPCIGISYQGNDPEITNSDMPNFGKDLIIDPSAQDKFVECYLNDLSGSEPVHTTNWFAKINYEYLDKAGERKTYSFYLYPDYSNVIEFLEDPANTESNTEIPTNGTMHYKVYFKASNSFAITFTITHPELAREFLSYLESGKAYDDNETRYVSITAYENGNYYRDYKIDKENKQEALVALIKAIRAHQAIGG